jgi:hypothetical protein
MQGACCGAPYNSTLGGTMAATGLLGLYWGPRHQKLDDCAQTWLGALTLLANNGFTSYYLKGRSRKEALRRSVDLTLESIKSILANGVNRRDDTHEPIPELGFHFAAWSGHSGGDAYSVSGVCGAWSEVISNTFLLNLLATGPYSIALARSPLKKVFSDLVTIWDADQAVLCDSKDLAWDNRKLALSMRSYERYERDAA